MKKLVAAPPRIVALLVIALAPWVAAGCDSEEAPHETATAGLAAEQCAGGECNVAEWIMEERYAEAREVLTLRLQDNQRDLKSILMLAAVELLDENFEHARVVVQDEIDHENYDPRLLEKRALASLLSDDLETAIEDFVELISELGRPELESNPAREAWAWGGLATAHYNSRDLDQAEDIARDVLAMADDAGFDRGYGEFVLGLTSAKRGEDDKARAYYESILARHPHHAPSLNNLGGIYYRMGDLKTARALLVQAYENAGNSRSGAAIAWSNVGEIDMLEGDFEAAEDKLLEATAISKRTSAPWWNLAMLYDLQAQDAKSSAHLTTALALDPVGVSRWNMSWFHDDWKLQFDALLLEHEGQLAEARPLWEQLLDSETEVLVETAKRHLGNQDKPLALFDF